MKPVKDIIKDKRLEHNMTMKELAEKVGVSEGTISRWESGEIANMRRGAITSLSKVLNIPPNVLMGWDEDSNSNSATTIDTRLYVANKIREYRKLRGLTQKELGDKIGVKHNTISGYEKGTNEPEQDLLFKIAYALNISINDLFPETTNPSLKLSNKEETIIKKYRFIPESGKKTVDAVLEIQYCEAKKHPTLKEPPVQFDIAASGLDENTEAGKDNMDIIKKRIEELRRK